MGMTFLFDGKRYEKTLYSITAFSREQVPGALEQMEKLRHSGHLVGYVRREAFALDHEPDATRGQPMALLKFHLFRKAMDEARAEGSGSTDTASSKGASLKSTTSQGTSRQGTFCPSIAARKAGRPTLLATRCPCGTIYRRLGQNLPHAGLVKDDFEELVFIGETAPVRIPDEKAPLRELLIQALGRANVLMGVFEAGGSLMVRERFALHRMAHGQHHVLLVDRDREDDILSRLVLPTTPLRARTRLEGGRALFLREHLERLALLAREHAVPAMRVERLLRNVSAVQLPLPGGHLLSGEEIACPWGLLPREVQEEYGLANGEVPAILEMTVLGDGTLKLASLPLDGSGAEVALDVEGACLDERTDLHFLDACLPLVGGGKGRGAEERETDTDHFVVNRFAAVAGLSRGSLLAGVGGKIVCPAGEDRARWSASLAHLLARGLVLERTLGLPQVLSAESLFRLSSLRGVERARLVPIIGQGDRRRQ